MECSCSILFRKHDLKNLSLLARFIKDLVDLFFVNLKKMYTFEICSNVFHYCGKSMTIDQLQHDQRIYNIEFPNSEHMTNTNFLGMSYV